VDNKKRGKIAPRSVILIPDLTSDIVIETLVIFRGKPNRNTIILKHFVVIILLNFVVDCFS
jgi:hypothetical protein